MVYGGWEIVLNREDTVKISYLVKAKDKNNRISKEELAEKLSSISDDITKEVAKIANERYEIKTMGD